MNFTQYLSYFSGIIDGDSVVPPYDDPDYMDYAKLNWSRTNRWLKKGVIDTEAGEVVKAVNQPQEWILITEPWCGDAAHSVPFIHMLAAGNPLITLSIELRDQAPMRIDQYLTNGTRSIPKLIVRDAKGNDLLTWGPRPAALQSRFDQMKADGHTLDAMKEELQKWYNQDKGQAVQQELAALLREHSAPMQQGV